MPRTGTIWAITGQPSVNPAPAGESDTERMLQALAGQQHGVVTRAQLSALGVGPRAIEYRLERGLLHRLHRGVYALGYPSVSQDARLLAAVLRGGPGAALSHDSAALLWSLRRPAGRKLHVTCARRVRASAAIRFHTARLRPDEVTAIRRVPVTTVPRTLLDLAAVLDRRRLERAINEAEVRRLGHQLSLAELLDRHPRHRGAATLRAIIDAGRIGEEVTRSELEDRFLAFLDRAGIERPELNVPLHVAGSWIEVDCMWRRQRLIVELDGRGAHATALAFERDRARDRALLTAGWRPVRVTWRQLHENPERLELELRTLLGHLHPPTGP